jgi:hypothetical protein
MNIPLIELPVADEAQTATLTPQVWQETDGVDFVAVALSIVDIILRLAHIQFVAAIEGYAHACYELSVYFHWLVSISE